MKQVWVFSDPWKKEIAIAAIEYGAEAIIVSEGNTAKVKEFGQIITVAPDGDKVIGRDVLFLNIGNDQDVKNAAALPSETIIVLKMQNWSIIPLENLIAQRKGIFVEVENSNEALTAVQILERGVEGVVLNTQNINEIRKTIEVIHSIMPKLDMETAKISEVKKLGMGHRVCVDTCSLINTGEGMLIGSSCDTFFLVQAESEDNPYVNARPFRVNAGSVHSYLLSVDGKTLYLSDLVSGSSVMVVEYAGNTSIAHVGRCKIERRPLILVAAEIDGRRKTVILQNAETVKLVQSQGKSISVASLEIGTEVLVHREWGGRHFGMRIEETIIEK